MGFLCLSGDFLMFLSGFMVLFKGFLMGFLCLSGDFLMFLWGFMVLFKGFQWVFYACLVIL